MLDADALNLLSQEKRSQDNRVLTPHPGEAARLLATDIADVEADRFAAVRKLQAQYGGVVLLKGAVLSFMTVNSCLLPLWGIPGSPAVGVAMCYLV